MVPQRWMLALRLLPVALQLPLPWRLGPWFRSSGDFVDFVPAVQCLCWPVWGCISLGCAASVTELLGIGSTLPRTCSWWAACVRHCAVWLCLVLVFGVGPLLIYHCCVLAECDTIVTCWKSSWGIWFFEDASRIWGQVVGLGAHPLSPTAWVEPGPLAGIASAGALRGQIFAFDFGVKFWDLSLDQLGYSVHNWQLFIAGQGLVDFLVA